MRLKQSRGFTLIQTVIALSLVAVVSTALVSVIRTTETKTNVLMARVQSITSGLLASKQDMGCYPDRLDGLLKPTTSTMCGTISGDLWKGAYIGLSTGLDPSTGNISIDDIVPGAQLTFLTRGTMSSSGPTTYAYEIATVGLTEEFARTIELFCGANSATRCSVSPDNQVHWTIDAAPAPVELTYDESTGVFTQNP